MDYTITTTDRGGRINAVDEGTTKGYLGFTDCGDSVVDAVTTQVPSEYGGQGIGTALIVELVDYARSNGLTIIPTCPFIEAYFEKNDDVRDVWHNAPSR